VRVVHPRFRRWFISRFNMDVFLKDIGPLKLWFNASAPQRETAAAGTVVPKKREADVFAD
jgi:hypothetical protein